MIKTYTLQVLQEDGSAVAVEGIFSDIATKIYESFHKIFHNVIEVTLRSFRGFSRSEMRFYKESHPVLYKKILKLNYIDLRNIKIPYPTGMTSTYAQGFDLTTDILSRHDVLSTIQDANRIMERIDKTGFVDEGFLKEVQIWTSNKRIYDLKKITVEMQHCFTTKFAKEETRPFKDMFKSMQEFSHVSEGLINSEKYFRMASKTFDHLMILDKTVDRVLEKMEGDNQLISKEGTQILYDFLHTTAQQIDVYGAVCTELQKIEHNFVLVMANLENNTN